MTEPKKIKQLKLKDLVEKFKDDLDKDLLVTLARSDGRGSTTFAGGSARMIRLMGAKEDCIELTFEEYVPNFRTTKP